MSDKIEFEQIHEGLIIDEEQLKQHYSFVIELSNGIRARLNWQDDHYVLDAFKRITKGEESKT